MLEFGPRVGTCREQSAGPKTRLRSAIYGMVGEPPVRLAWEEVALETRRAAREAVAVTLPPAHLSPKGGWIWPRN